MLPLGLGIVLGADSFLALGTGLAAMGATGSLDDAILVPIELQFEYGDTYHLMLRARDSFVFGADGRKNGAPSLPIGDGSGGQRFGVRIGKSDTTSIPMGYSSASPTSVRCSARATSGCRSATRSVWHGVSHSPANATSWMTQGPAMSGSLSRRSCPPR